MNQEKARDFFSAYYEGSLEKGLLQAFEQRLGADMQLQAEYRAFARTMQELNLLREEAIEVPQYLSDRIATRIEQARSAKQKSPFLLWLPRLAFGTFVAVAVVGSIVGIFSRGRSTEATFIPSGVEARSEAITVSQVGSRAVIHYMSATPKSVSIIDNSGQVLQSYNLAAEQALEDTELVNPNSSATRFEVKVSDGGPDIYVLIPGRNPAPSTKNYGSVMDYASALSDHFRIPVVVNTKSQSKPLSWTFDGLGAVKDASATLDGTGYEVSLSGTDVVTISGQ
jgi:hypothetical protein